MKTVQACLMAFICALFFRNSAMAEKSWEAVLSTMPLNAHATELNETNCVPLILNAFQSNSVVKALIFMPGATDELYFFHRVHARLAATNPSLANAIGALTNQTCIQADFRAPFLLLHTTEDVVDPIAIVKSRGTAAKLRRRMVSDRMVFNDCAWDDLRTALRRELSVELRPFANAPDSWHFYHHTFAACGLSQWELLEAVALSGKTTFTLHWWTADFRLDTRNGPTPGLKSTP